MFQMPSTDRERDDRSQSPSAAGRGSDHASPYRARDALAPSIPTTSRSPCSNRRPVVIPACDRCRSHRKKCSRTFPACTLCVSARKTCSYREPPATPEAEAVQLRARVQWFTEYINRHQSSVQRTNVENVETGSDLSSLLQPSAPHGSVESVGSTSSRQWTESPQTTDHARLMTTASPSKVDGSRALVPSNKMRKNLEKLSHLARRLRESQSTLFYLVMSTGCSPPEQTTQGPCEVEKRLEGAFAEIIQDCLCRTDIESVQVLTLLALYSLFNPTGASAYALIGIAARQAITTGLTRKPPNNRAYAPAERELRHRLYWCIFTLDTMMAVSQGLPATLRSHAEVPYPSLTVEEFASAERSTHAQRLQTSRHVIQLRQLEARILDQVHFKEEEEIAELTPSNRRAILKGLHASIDDWYSQGCLISPTGDDRATVHSSATWLNARYYYLLVLLYYPNHFNNSACAMSWYDIQQFAQLHLQATAALFHQQQLPLNCNTLYRLLPICLVLMYTFAELCRGADCSSKSTFPFSAKDEVQVALSVLEAFPPEWNIARRAAQVQRQFAGIISGSIETFLRDDHAFPLDGNGMGSMREPDRSQTSQSLAVMVQPCISTLTGLMQESLGETTCFQYVELLPNTTSQRAVGFAKTGSQHPVASQQQRQQSFPSLHQDQSFPVEQQSSGIGIDDTLGYVTGWPDLDLNFL